jgi:peptide/nickel transport system substrate-binding protein
MHTAGRHRGTRRDFLKTSATLVAGAVAAGRLAELHAATGDSKMVIAYGIALVTLDPQKHENAVHESVLRNIYEPLVTFSADLTKMEPLLASSFSRLNDLTIQFKLRQGVSFHNGEELDAQAVKFTVERALNPETKAPLVSVYQTIDRVEVLDRYTINVVTKKPDPVLLRRMASFHMNIVPPKHFATASADELARRPVGTGPYKFVSWAKDGDFVMEAHPAYWGQKAAINRVTMRTIPEAGTRVAAILAGDVDVVTAMPPDEIDRVNRSGRARAITLPGNRIAFYNIAVRREPTSNKLFRQAVNYASNMDAIIKTILGGHGFRRAVISNPWHVGFDPGIQPYPYDPAKAKALLVQAGYAAGVSVDMHAIQGRYPKDKEIAEALAGELGKVGIKANLRFYEWGNLFQIGDAGKIENGLIFWSWGNPWHDADGTYYPLFRSGTRYTKNWTGYSNEQLDALLEQGRTVLDEGKRKEIYSRVQRLMQDDAPALFMHAVEDIYGVNTRLEWRPRSDEMVRHYEMSLKP